ncbi:hypothetical protein BDV3_002815 [Batrachochytrium dendrobatidis]
MKPEVSWVARWQRVDKFSKGLYAIRVGGQLPYEVEEELIDKGIKLFWCWTDMFVHIKLRLVAWSYLDYDL